MQNSNKIKVLIADDEVLVREGLAAVLNRHAAMEVAAQIDKLPQLVESIRHYHPHVLLIDLRLDGADTTDSIQKMHKEFPSLAILVLSSHDGSEAIYRALRAGARGYALKSISDTELIAAIQTVSAGRRHISPEIAVRLAERMDRSTLTPRELEVLQFIVKGKSNKEIADVLNVTEATVKYHINGILSKLGVSDRTQAATVALLRGIIHPKDL